MVKITGSPSKYIQGPNAINELAKFSAMYGINPLILIDGFLFDTIKPLVEKNFNGQKILLEKFNAECSMNEINRIINVMKENKNDIVISIGGGKTIDTGKAVAFMAHKPNIVCPTSASTNAPYSALSVIYNDDYSFDKYLILDKNPDIVLADSILIAKAPRRLFVAGMGDALSTYFEILASYQSQSLNLYQGFQNKAILVMGKLCHDTLMNKGLEAYLSMAHQVPSPSVEDIIETNIYLAGIAGESGGLAAAHAIHNGFTLIPETHNILHGEKVSFCTIVQLVLEDQSRELLSQVINFCLDVGLPVSLADLNIKKIDYDLIKKVSELACAPKESIHREPFKVTPDMVYNAILSANEIGNYYKNKRS